jgi:glucoamylase
MQRGKILWIIVAADATVIWTADQWAGTNKIETTKIAALNLRFADLPTHDLRSNSVVEFTFYWKDTQRWEGGHWQIGVEQC